jgi:mannose-6-phosphate isomerase-like protein (cupin superfamily)
VARSGSPHGNGDPFCARAFPSAHGAEIRAAQIHELLKGADIDATLAKINGSLDVIVKPNFALVFRTVDGKSTGWRAHPDADEIWIIRKGTARVLLRKSASGAQQYTINAGDSVSTTRTQGYEIDPGAGRFEHIVLRVSPRSGICAALLRRVAGARTVHSAGAELSGHQEADRRIHRHSQ